MPKLRNINPLGHVDVPLLNRQGDPVGEHGTGCLEPGEVFEVDAATAKVLLEQPDNYVLVKEPKPRKPRTTTKKAAAAPAVVVVDEKG